jgi:hypothetical protein
MRPAMLRSTRIAFASQSALRSSCGSGGDSKSDREYSRADDSLVSGKPETDANGNFYIDQMGMQLLQTHWLLHVVGCN